MNEERAGGPVRSVAAAIALVTLSAGLAAAGTTGRLAGRVLDEKRQPLAGVNVALPAARLGAVTGEDGRYSILNVPSGPYEVRASLLGYRSIVTQNVEIRADNTTALDLTLTEAPVQLQEIVVRAKRPVVDVNLTSTLASVNREELQRLPVQELQDVVNLQAGVVDGHFRGGRLGEVQYQVDGVSVNNPYDNTSSLRLDRSLLQEVQVISGTFDAEYGQAMSGVVNAVLRRGDDRFAWDGEALLGGYPYSSHSGRLGSPEFQLADVQNFQLSLSGPLGPPKMTGLMNVRYGRRDEWLHSTRRYTTAPDTADVDAGETPKILVPDGDFAPASLGYTHEWSGVVKLANRSIPGAELSYQAVANLVRAQRTAWDWRFAPDGLTRKRTFSIAHGGDWTQTLGKKSYLTLSVRENLFDYRDVAFQDPYDPRYDAAGPPQPEYTPATGVIIVSGVDLTRFAQKTDTWVAKGTFETEVHKLHHIKTGIEGQWPKIFFGTPTYVVAEQGPNGIVLDRFVEDLPKFPAAQSFHPAAFSGYAQDEIEWEGLRVRAGLRLDTFDARTTVPSDPANPANDIDGAPESVPVTTTAKVNWSPRIGVSYPVSPRTSLFFAYGHFVQMPSLGQIFDNANYGTLSELQARVSYATVGNPDIRPERSIQYQVGMKQAITEDLGLDLNAFYKDIRDLLGVEFISTYNDAEYPRLTNVDFGSVIGATISIDQRDLGPLSLSLDYTWQMARGNSSDPRETATRAQGNLDARPRQVPFNWDQRHTFNATASLMQPDRYTMSAVLRTGSGQPYTPSLSYGTNSLEINSGRKPAFLLLDLRGEWPVELGGIPVRAFARLFNCFDARYQNGFVFASSGSPFYSSQPNADATTLGDPTRFYGPRRLELGVTMRGGGR